MQKTAGEKTLYLRNRRIFNSDKKCPYREENVKVRMEIIDLENKTQTNRKTKYKGKKEKKA